MPALPNQLNTTSASGSQWVTSYQLQNDDGTLMNITGKTFEFVIRPTTSDATEPALVSVNSTAANAQGYITVTPATSTLLVVLSPTATALIGQSAYPYSLWMDPGLSDATDLVTGTFYNALVAAA
ncbi:hypothetical protein [Kitasatospora sp. NBC_01302]|uniref:hypothetical protein n=1 Tax=Kitasatospora sp. NBC_01302 TaxID=2903575 RepID=UPI002E1045E7|nr:hypothetical protein OG294_14330 [Kitasatospora sp. NBC_01302]